MNKIKNNKGFTILFAVVLSSIILAISLGVANIAFKEIRFGTSAKEANNAFFAADTGAECALFNDKSSSNSFVQSGGTGNVQCLGTTVALSGSYPLWNFILSGLGSAGQSCVKITVDKTVLPTIIISKGYNDGGSVSGACTQGPNSVERELQLSY
jgi:hypothetical protein